ncbi:peptidylprolyl isomerase [Alteromonas pelagimontana]|uniref:Periplasmic chaperone PpiD n=1 Tax=Alteromonas pelagimontana TaxID=1858656 RepID=A0A6M4MIY2_9ALTE|nr:SurA N-terminal domain-containing protein [Alteromonas pelagimontana]QJR82066.1 peptidylprolyl isomerase [Alteromonas pelagimontana]
MLERIREGSQGPWAMIIIGLVVLSFVFAGVGSYLTSSGSTVAATVNGQEISLDTLERAYQNQRQRMEAQYGESVSAMFADEGYLREFRQGVLERLIGDTLVEQKAREVGLRISDAQIRDTIRQMPEFQTAGTFDNNRYISILRQNGFQASDFRDYLRVELTRKQLASGLGASAFALPSEVQRVYDLQAQTRDARYLTVNAAPFAESIDVSDSEIQNYYEANITAFDTQEKVNIAYVNLSVDDLKDDVTVSDGEIDEYYQNNQDRYRKEEQRRVSHILIEFGDDEAAAKAEAEALLAKIKDGADFAQVAKENSQDTLSAENGGDLDFISPDMMDSAFDEAAFGLANKGDVSGVVETEFGYHIIKLTDVKPEQVTPFEEVSTEIRETLLADKATEKFFDLQSRMAEVAFEVPDTLEDVAGVANKEIKETGLFNQASAPAPMDNPAALSAAFSPELIEDGVNSELIELDENNVVVMRVKEHEPQRTRSLEEVKSRIESSLRAEKAQQAAMAWAESLVAKTEAGESIEDMLAQYDLDWKSVEGVNRAGGELPANLAETLFRLAPTEGEKTDVVSLTSGDVGVIELTAVNTAEKLDDSVKADLKQRLASNFGQSTYESFVSALREEADVSIASNL